MSVRLRSSEPSQGAAGASSGPAGNRETAIRRSVTSEAQSQSTSAAGSDAGFRKVGKGIERRPSFFRAIQAAASTSSRSDNRAWDAAKPMTLNPASAHAQRQSAVALRNHPPSSGTKGRLFVGFLRLVEGSVQFPAEV